jgi:hypothetical protein
MWRVAAEDENVGVKRRLCKIEITRNEYVTNVTYLRQRADIRRSRAPVIPGFEKPYRLDCFVSGEDTTLHSNTYLPCDQASLSRKPGYIRPTVQPKLYRCPGGVLRGQLARQEGYICMQIANHLWIDS